MKNPWDLRYDTPEYVYGLEPNGFLASVADRIPPGPVLCLADGEGRNGVFLASLGNVVTSVDASAVGMEKARRLAEERGVVIETVTADLADFTIAPGAWAGIISIFAHLPPDLRANVHAACVSGLQPGGTFVLEAYTPGQLSLGTGGPPTAELMMDAATLRHELAGLDFEVLDERRRDVVEGCQHTGEAAVVQVFGIKPPA